MDYPRATDDVWSSTVKDVTISLSVLTERIPEGPLPRAFAHLNIPDMAVEEVLYVTGARVAVAEYEALQHDFPELRAEHILAHNPALWALSTHEQARAVRTAIDEWLIAQTAIISLAQAEHAVVNTEIATSGRRGLACRPPRYGRAVVLAIDGAFASDGGDAVVMEESPGKLVDLKGCGVAPNKTPSHGYNSSGLEYLGIALSDFMIKKVIDEILRRELPNVWTVPVYAVLDLGFDIVDGYRGTGPAGLHVRRAHTRPNLRNTMCRRTSLDIELTLRRYGLTAAPRGLQLHISTESGSLLWRLGEKNRAVSPAADRIGLSLALLKSATSLTIDQRDVQLAGDVSWPPASAQIVDFGALRVEERFDNPITQIATDLSYRDILWPTDPAFVQPDPELRLPLNIWNRYILADHCSSLAEDYRGGRLSQEALRRLLDEPVVELLAHWSGRQRHFTRE